MSVGRCVTLTPQKRTYVRTQSDGPWRTLDEVGQPVPDLVIVEKSRRPRLDKWSAQPIYECGLKRMAGEATARSCATLFCTALVHNPDRDFREAFGRIGCQLVRMVLTVAGTFVHMGRRFEGDGSGSKRTHHAGREASQRDRQNRYDRGTHEVQSHRSH